MRFSGRKDLIHSFALVGLLGFELLYYLIIIQTGLTHHFNSNLVALFPLFFGGVLGTAVSALKWGKIVESSHKVIIALSMQLALSFLYPDFNIVTLFVLGIVVGANAPLIIYLFSTKQKHEIVLALGIAYTLGTYLFNINADARGVIALSFSAIALFCAVFLRDYVPIKKQVHSKGLVLILTPLFIWAYLDSTLFETLLRDEGLNIWPIYTKEIILFHLLGLGAFIYNSRLKYIQHHFIIGVLFCISYLAAFNNLLLMLVIIYPMVISYYNLVIFSSLIKLKSQKQLSFMMLFIGWISSGAGLGSALYYTQH